MKKINLEKKCREKFPDLVRKAIVLKWVKAAQRERWEDLPPQVQNRIVATPNSWRSKLGLDKKGRVTGGYVPHLLQEELDKLIMDMVSGTSDISERKEVVTAEDVVPWSCFCFWVL